jgi:hypothetical protein
MTATAKLQQKQVGRGFIPGNKAVMKGVGL